MTDVLLRSRLVARGFGDGDLARLQTAGELTRVRRGAYARADPTSGEVEHQHRLLIEATVPQLVRGSTLSHGSAAVVRDLPVEEAAVTHVHLTRPRSGGGRIRSLVQVHTSPLDPQEVEIVDGLAVTSLARTVADLSRVRPFAEGVAAADRALRFGLSGDELDLAVGRAAGWPGASTARRVAAFADGRAESVGESVSRVLLAELGVPTPDLQLEITDGAVLVGRVDFAWPSLGVVGEFDGKVKYGRLLRDGDDVGEVVHREKLREDALRDLGWQVVRWTWPDLAHPEVIVQRLLRAVRRARR